MKKVILSLAVLAASAAYVVFERQYDNSASFSPALVPLGSQQPGDGQALPPLSLDPAVFTETAPAATSVGPIAATDTASAPSALVAQAQAAATQYRDGTYKGSSEDAYWGRVQVQAIVQGGKITSVKMVDYPHDRRRSAQISQAILPTLMQEAVSNQSARVDTFSGATLTSEAFQLSLANALRQAGGGSGGNA